MLYMGKRKRITKELIGEVVIDELAYIQNKASKNARKIVERGRANAYEIWYDKHYLTRVHFGGDDGTKRDGISEDIIQDLVSKSIQHLIYYCFKVKNFTFVNFEEGGRSTRILLQKDTNPETLNVVVEFHHLSNNRYEVTVITALVVDDFRLSDGQYAILIDDESSTLFKFDNKILVQVATK